MVKPNRGQSTKHSQHSRRQKEHKSKKDKNNFEEGKESINDWKQISNGAKKTQPKPETIRTVIQIVKYSINIFKEILHEYDQTHPKQQSIIMELVTSQQWKYLSQIMNKFLNLRIQTGRKSEIYQILYCYEKNEEGQIPKMNEAKRKLRLIIYQIYYKYYSRIWKQFARKKYKSNTPQNIGILKKYISFQVTDFRDLIEQKQQKIKKRQKTKINYEKEKEKIYQDPNDLNPKDQSKKKVQEFIYKLMPDEKKQNSFMSEKMIQEERFSHQLENQSQFYTERMQEQKIQDWDNIDQYLYL